MYRIRSNHCALLVSVAILSISTTVDAVEIKPNASFGMRYTDNARKVSINEEDDFIAISRVGASVDAGSGPFKLDANTSLSYNNYIQDSFGIQRYFNLDATAGWEMLKDRIKWQVKDIFSQQLINSLNPDAPDNIQDTNVFTFGPVIDYRISGRHSMTFKPEYRRFTYGSQNNDNQQDSLDISWNYKLFRTMSVGMRGGVNKTDYDDVSQTDNTFRNIHLTLSAKRADYNYDAKVGTTNVDSGVGKGVRGITGNVNWSFDITGFSSLRAHVSSDITDANNNLLNAAINPDDGGLLGEDISAEVLRKNNFRVTYKRSSAALIADIWIELNKQDYLFALLDREVKAAGFNFVRPVTAVLSIGINASYNNIESTDIARTDEIVSIGSSVNYRWTRKLSGMVDIKYINKDSSEKTVNLDYTEKSVFATVVYSY